jgi:hypothetical protein
MNTSAFSFMPFLFLLPLLNNRKGKRYLNQLVEIILVFSIDFDQGISFLCFKKDISRSDQQHLQQHEAAHENAQKTLRQLSLSRIATINTQN